MFNAPKSISCQHVLSAETADSELVCHYYWSQITLVASVKIILGPIGVGGAFS